MTKTLPAAPSVISRYRSKSDWRLPHPDQREYVSPSGGS
jgi:hypothetical protein